jgi:hypothetical protein
LPTIAFQHGGDGDIGACRGGVAMKLDDNNAKENKKKGGNYAMKRKPIGKG